MKIAFFSVREDEIVFINKFAKKYQIEITINHEPLTLSSVNKCQGAQAISIITTKTDRAIIQKLKEYQISYISTRTIGFDHIDLTACQEYQIHVGNVSYSPASVSEYTIMLILMSLRKMKIIMERYNTQDFSLKGIRGKELKDLTVGIIGTGKIGQEVIKRLQAFSCQLLACDQTINPTIKDLVTYEDLPTLLKNSDIITLHLPSNSQTKYLIKQNSLKLMKDGVIIINTARGDLIKNTDLIKALENHKIGYVALDVIEDETTIYYRDYKNQIINHPTLAILRSFPNVLLTPHTAFYTEEAVSDMIEYSIISCLAAYKKEDNPWLII